ncbi:MAG: hypothetical protein ACLP9S_06735 [Syntrophales bacterium]|jgi:hypothetical protein
MKLKKQYDQVTIGIFTPYLVDVLFEESRQSSIAFPWGFGSDIRITAASFGAGHTVNLLPRGTVSPFGNVKLKKSRDSNTTIKVKIAGRTYVKFDIR